MQREPLMDAVYFDRFVEHTRATTAKWEARLAATDTSASGRVHCSRYIFKNLLHDLIARYSRGEPIGALTAAFPAVVSAAERYQQELGRQDNDFASIDDYVVALWLVSLAITFDADLTLFARLVGFLGNVGKDQLFERLVATRLSPRSVASGLLWPRPYESLYIAIDATSADRPKLMQKFLKGWYKSLRHCYWYENHKGPEGGGFFGYWCLEAAGAVKAFDIDDTDFRDLPYYPRDLVKR